MEIDNSPGRVGRRLLLWTIVCSISALPSFIWSTETDYDLAAKFCGLGLFIIAYTAFSCTAITHAWRRRPFVKEALYSGYIARLVFSIIFPLGMMVDLGPGMLSVSIVESLFGPDHSFVPTLLTTLAQGTLLSIILGLYILFIYGLQRLFRKPPVFEGYCRKCDYDLRSSPIRCPECGEPAPVKASEAATVSP